MKPVFFITGTDTGAGKTVLATLLVRFLRRRGMVVAGLKPICSGGRDDAREMLAAGGDALALDEINPWYFRAAIAPLLAARAEKRKITRSRVVAHVRAIQKQFEAVVVEGAGGLLSPLGENFDSRDLVLALRATPIIVAQNRLGAINHVRLTLEALPEKFQRLARVVFMTPARPDSATRSNPKLLAEFFDSKRIFLLPRLRKGVDPLEDKAVRRTVQNLSGVP
jgi:dethiobiotin synthetase